MPGLRGAARRRLDATTRGDRRHIVTFEAPGDPVPDGEGGYTYTWTSLTPAGWYVAIRPATAADAEAALAGTQITHVSHVITGDYHPGVTTATRMLFKNQIYQVTSAIDDDAREITMTLVADLQS
jgi:head-tail adaptor